MSGAAVAAAGGPKDLAEPVGPPSGGGPLPPRLGRRRRTALTSALTVGVVLAAFVGLLATRKSALDRQARSPLLGRTAPSLTGLSILDGAPVDLSALRGRYVLVNFLASWCVACQHEQAQLTRLAHELGGRMAVVGVVFSDSPGPVRAFMRSTGADFAVVDDPQGQVALDYGVRGPPESFLVSPSGVVLAKFIGEVTATGVDGLVAKIEAPVPAAPAP